jgi:NADPH:quinone reductase-like Zn-dependent oxidoreductase
VPFGLEVNNIAGTLEIGIADYDLAALSPVDVRVRITAAALNYRDYALMQGSSFGTAPDQYVPFSDACGVVDEIGTDVTEWKVGDRVCSLFFPGWMAGRPDLSSRFALGSGGKGVGQQIFTAPQNTLIAAPETLSDIEAATLPCAAVTAWNAVMSAAGLRAGDIILVQGTGGVSLFALQFAVAAGFKVIVTSSSDKKIEQAIAMGAAFGINYRETPNWAAEAVKLTDGRGVDLIVEVGGGGTFAQSLEAIRVGGHISVVGMLTGAEQQIDIRYIYGKCAQIRGISVGSREDFVVMSKAIDAHGILPTVNKIYPWREAKEAMMALEKGGGFGKIVLDFQAD